MWPTCRVCAGGGAEAVLAAGGCPAKAATEAASPMHKTAATKVPTATRASHISLRVRAGGSAGVAWGDAMASEDQAGERMKAKGRRNQPKAYTNPGVGGAAARASIRPAFRR